MFLFSIKDSNRLSAGFSWIRIKRFSLKYGAISPSSQLWQTFSSKSGNEKGNPNALTLFWSQIGSNTCFLKESLENKRLKGTHRWNQVGLHSERMQHGDLFSSRPALTRSAGQTLSQPFKTFAAPLHNVSKFPFSQRKTKNEKKKKRSASLLLCRNLRSVLAGLEQRHSVTTLTKQAPLGRCEMKNGTFRTSVKFQWVGAAECVCKRLLAIDDLSGEAMKPSFIRADTLSPCRQPIVTEPFLTLRGTLINTAYRQKLLFPHYSLHFPKYLLFTLNSPNSVFAEILYLSGMKSFNVRPFCVVESDHFTAN